MQNVVLVVHLILALCLIAIVLFQRSEGGGLGIGGGGNPMGGRAQASPLSRVTWALAVAFLVTSMALTILAARLAESDSVLERLGTPIETESEGDLLPPSLGDNLMPPTSDDSPATPPKQE